MNKKKVKNLLKEAGVLLIAAIIGLNTVFVFTPIAIEAKASIETENIGTQTTLTFYGTIQ